MSWFYGVFFLQVKVTEIFDVTQTDPSLLIADEQGVDYRLDITHKYFGFFD